jgi:hypothetical protein
MPVGPLGPVTFDTPVGPVGPATVLCGPVGPCGPLSSWMPAPHEPDAFGPYSTPEFTSSQKSPLLPNDPVGPLEPE